MKKFLTVLFAVFITALMLSGCDNEKVEESWEKAKTAHTIIKAAGAAVIDSGVVSNETADKLKTADNALVKAGSTVEKIYENIQEKKRVQLAL